MALFVSTEHKQAVSPFFRGETREDRLAVDDFCPPYPRANMGSVFTQRAPENWTGLALKTSPPPRDTHLSWAKKAMCKTAKKGHDSGPPMDVDPTKPHIKSLGSRLRASAKKNKAMNSCTCSNPCE